MYIFNNKDGDGDPLSATEQNSIKGIVTAILNCTGVTLRLTKKELRKQLKSVGFVKWTNGGKDLQLRQDGNYVQLLLNGNLWINKELRGVYADFKGIAEEVKHMTGIDLTPIKKPTKRQEIEALKVEIEKVSLSHQADSDKFRVNQRLLEGAMTEILKRIEALEAKTKGLNLEFQFNDKKPTIIEESVFEHGSGESRKVSLYGTSTKASEAFKEGGKCIVKPCLVYVFGLSDSKRKLAESNTIVIIQDVCGNHSIMGGLEITTNEGRFSLSELEHVQEEEEEAPKEEEKPFEVGDPVVLKNCKIDSGHKSELRTAVRDLLVCVIDEVVQNEDYEAESSYWVVIPQIVALGFGLLKANSNTPQKPSKKKRLWVLVFGLKLWLSVAFIRRAQSS